MAILVGLLCALHCLFVGGLHLRNDARQLSHHRYYLGYDQKSGQHGYAFVHHHTDHYGGHGATRKRQALQRCSAPISEGARWRSSAGYRVHTRNLSGMSAEFVLEAIEQAFGAWRCALADRKILAVGPRTGAQSRTPASAVDMTRPTGVNEVGFGPIVGKPGTVAVTVVWGVFTARNVSERFIGEFKMRFNEPQYAFGNASLSSAVMDLQAIATHEAGHAHGLDDIYDAGCEHVTMFGTSRPGERRKRSIESIDSNALHVLYGQ